MCVREGERNEKILRRGELVKGDDGAEWRGDQEDAGRWKGEGDEVRWMKKKKKEKRKEKKKKSRGRDKKMSSGSVLLTNLSDLFV